MALNDQFDKIVPAYRMGKKYGIEPIEDFLDSIDALCAQDTSPLPGNENISADHIIATLMEISEEVPADTARLYLEGMAQSVRIFEGWLGRRDTKINDEFHEFFGGYNLHHAFSSWASQASQYHPEERYCPIGKPNVLEDRLKQAETDLTEAIADMRGKELYSDEVGEAWLRAEDALYYVISHGLTPETPEKKWHEIAAKAAYVFSVDNMRDNENKRIGGLARVKKPADYDGPLTDKELEKIVIFEGKYPASRGSEISFVFGHKTESLPYEEKIDQYFNRSILYFNALTRRQDHDVVLAV